MPGSRPERHGSRHERIPPELRDCLQGEWIKSGDSSETYVVKNDEVTRYKRRGLVDYYRLHFDHKRQRIVWGKRGMYYLQAMEDPSSRTKFLPGCNYKLEWQHGEGGRTFKWDRQEPYRGRYSPRPREREFPAGRESSCRHIMLRSVARSPRPSPDRSPRPAARSPRPAARSPRPSLPRRVRRSPTPQRRLPRPPPPVTHSRSRSRNKYSTTTGSAPVSKTASRRVETESARTESARQTQHQEVCENGHPMEEMNARYRGQCNACRRYFEPGEATLTCVRCEYDHCSECMKGGPSTLKDEATRTSRNVSRSLRRPRKRNGVNPVSSATSGHIARSKDSGGATSSRRRHDGEPEQRDAALRNERPGTPRERLVTSRESEVADEKGVIQRRRSSGSGTTAVKPKQTSKEEGISEAGSPNQKDLRLGKFAKTAGARSTGGTGKSRARSTPTPPAVGQLPPQVAARPKRMPLPPEVAVASCSCSSDSENESLAFDGEERESPGLQAMVVESPSESCSSSSQGAVESEIDTSCEVARLQAKATATSSRLQAEAVAAAAPASKDAVGRADDADSASSSSASSSTDTQALPAQKGVATASSKDDGRKRRRTSTEVVEKAEAADSAGPAATKGTAQAPATSPAQPGGPAKPPGNWDTMPRPPPAPPRPSPEPAPAATQAAVDQAATSQAATSQSNQAGEAGQTSDAAQATQESVAKPASQDNMASQTNQACPIAQAGGADQDVPASCLQESVPAPSSVADSSLAPPQNAQTEASSSSPVPAATDTNTAQPQHGMTPDGEEKNQLTIEQAEELLAAEALERAEALELVRLMYKAKEAKEALRRKKASQQKIVQEEQHEPGKQEPAQNSSGHMEKSSPVQEQPSQEQQPEGPMQCPDKKEETCASVGAQSTSDVARAENSATQQEAPSKEDDKAAESTDPGQSSESHNRTDKAEALQDAAMKDSGSSVAPTDAEASATTQRMADNAQPVADDLCKDQGSSSSTAASKSAPPEASAAVQGSDSQVAEEKACTVDNNLKSEGEQSEASDAVKKSDSCVDPKGLQDHEGAVCPKEAATDHMVKEARHEVSTAASSSETCVDAKTAPAPEKENPKGTEARAVDLSRLRSVVRAIEEAGEPDAGESNAEASSNTEPKPSVGSKQSTPRSVVTSPRRPPKTRAQANSPQLSPSSSAMGQGGPDSSPADFSAGTTPSPVSAAVSSVGSHPANE
mmetsp:Transcript_13727/g.26080  ORF Transcript_13727/g.26080 Transcript_13727/m.26080 type:complete len:1216 (+) Transcript_13727:148-3795(+)